MPWNEPGSGGDKDPWEQRRRKQDGPPDLDQIMNDAKRRVDSMFGKKGSNGGNGGGGGGSVNGSGISFGLFGLVALVLLGIWLFSGFYKVDQGTQGVELTFGKYSTTTDAGLHWHFPSPIQTVEIVNVQKENTVEVGYRSSGRQIKNVPAEALMLTEDENIIDVQFAVQYDINDPTKLLFNVSEYQPLKVAESVVRQATESAVRELVGSNTMDFAITTGRSQLAQETKSLLQNILDRYETGISVRSVEMQNAQPPKQVADAFADVIKAREDEVRLKNLAEAYANDILPRARGRVSRVLQNAEAYRESVIAQADGEASRFTQVLSEYEKAPSVTRERLYIETLEDVLGNSNKLVIDQQSGGNNVMYLPLDQMIKQNRENKRSESTQFDGIANDFSRQTDNAVDSSSGQSGRSESSRVSR